MKYSYLITGGAGYLGAYITKQLLKEETTERLVIFSRDELKHFRLRNEISDPRLEFVIGDVRDSGRVEEAMKGMDVVVHAAAMKHLDICEQNPGECIKTNVNGTENLIRAARNAGVKHLFLISTDKAVEPVSVYGNSKQSAEKLTLRANNSEMKTYVIRLGNLMGSSGSLLEKIDSLELGARFTLFHPDLTRFVDSNQNAYKLMMLAMERNFSGCILLPKLNGIRVKEFVEQRRPDLKIEILTGRPFEKVHEQLISTNEYTRLLENEGCYLIAGQELSETEALDAYRSLPSKMKTYSSTSVGFADNELLLKPNRG